MANRLNYTRRVDLTTRHVRVTLGGERGDGARTFGVELDLPGELPEAALLALEAYSSSPPVRMRFDLGTVGSPRLPTPEEARLSAFPAEVETPYFRLKAIDPAENMGRLLADARQIRPVNAADKADTRLGLLYIGHRELDGPVWELEVDRAGFEPTLWIDTEADPARELARDPVFVALVYPTVFRAVLTHLVIDEELNAVDDETEWGYEWFRMALELPGMSGERPPSPDDDPEEMRGWIDRAVRAFAQKAEVCELIAPAESEDSA